jgi:hypothetical protein
MTEDTKKAAQPLLHGLLATGMAAGVTVVTYLGSLVYMPANLMNRMDFTGPIVSMLGALGSGLVSFAVLFVTFMVHGNSTALPAATVRRWVYCLVLGNGALYGVLRWLAEQPAAPYGF